MEEGEIWDMATAWIERDQDTLSRARILTLIEEEAEERKSLRPVGNEGVGPHHLRQKNSLMLGTGGWNREPQCWCLVYTSNEEERRRGGELEERGKTYGSHSSHERDLRGTASRF